jgi:hypothetical protein
VQQLSALELVNQMQGSVANSFCGDSEMALPVTWLKTNQTQSSKCLRREAFKEAHEPTNNRMQEPCL